MSSIDAQEIGQRLRSEIDRLGGASLVAPLVGVHRNTVANWTANAGADAAQLARLAELGADVTYVLSGTRTKSLEEGLGIATRTLGRMTEFLESGEAQKIRVLVADQEHFVNPNDYRWVPVLNVRLSGGSGIANLFENITAFNAYRKAWLADWGLLEAVLSEARVTGRSMEPELRDGDMVLVNHSPSDFIGGDIYALRQGEDLLVKYLQKLPGDRIQVISENTNNFPTYVIEPSEFESGECEIIGRVEHQGRHRGRRSVDSRLVPVT